MNQYLPTELPISKCGVQYRYDPMQNITLEPKTESFPSKLYRLLSSAEAEGAEHIVSWSPHGRAFRVHNVLLFKNEILPRLLNKAAKMPAFRNQLERYGFKEVQNGIDQGAFFHRKFLRGEESLVNCMKEGEAPPKDEPDFYKLPCMPADPKATGTDRSKDTTGTLDQRKAAQEDVKTVNVPPALVSDPDALAERLIQILNKKTGGTDETALKLVLCDHWINTIDILVPMANEYSKGVVVMADGRAPKRVLVHEDTIAKATVVEDSSVAEESLVDSTASTTTHSRGVEFIDLFEEADVEGFAFEDYNEEAEARLFSEIATFHKTVDMVGVQAFETDSLSQAEAYEADLIKSFDLFHSA